MRRTRTRWSIVLATVVAAVTATPAAAQSPLQLILTSPANGSVYRLSPAGYVDIPVEGAFNCAGPSAPVSVVNPNPPPSSFGCGSDGIIRFSYDLQVTQPGEHTIMVCLSAPVPGTYCASPPPEGGPVVVTVLPAHPDLTAPEVAIDSPPDGATFDVGQEVAARYGCQDEPGGSGIATCAGSVPDGAPLDTSSPGDRVLTVTAFDRAGNPSTRTHRYRVEAVDRTDPDISIESPAEGAAFERGKEAAAHFSCSDTGSGIASCDGSVPNGGRLDTATAGEKALTVTAVDRAGNSATRTHRYVVFDPDRTAPTISILQPQDGASYRLDEEVPALFHCADESGGSGIADCAGSVPSGARIDTSTPGERELTVTAVDRAGNRSTAVRRFTVRNERLAATLTVPLSIQSPPDGARLTVGDRVLAVYDCTGIAGGSPVACDGPVPSGGLVDTSSPGEHLFTVTAVRVDGTRGSLTHRYTVVAECEDDRDNDGDGVVDHPGDPDCESGQDGERAGVTFDWTVPDRLVDRDDDGLVDYPGRHELAPERWPVDFAIIEGCDPDAMYEWRWRASGKKVTRLARGCVFRGLFPGEGVYGVGVREFAAGRPFARRDVLVQDWLVVALGDSVASGEGNPHVAGTEAERVWEDRRCHRSALSGPTRAADLLERRDPKTSVSFVHLACSGAKVLDGVTGEFAGTEPPRRAKPLPPQAQDARGRVGDREVDAVTLSVGANDVHFGPLTVFCTTNVIGMCQDQRFDPRNAVLGYRGGRRSRKLHDEVLLQLDRLPDGYRQVAEMLERPKGAPWVDRGRTYITEYFNPTRDASGVLCERALAVPFVGLGFDRPELEWAERTVIAGLNKRVRATRALGWNVVRGIAKAFLTHGLCAPPGARWVRTLEEANELHGGAVHPNAAGHVLYGERIRDEIVRDLYPAGVARRPGP